MNRHAPGAERFTTDAKFARQTGTAPILASSGKHNDTDCTAAATATQQSP
jgi:hypothetical protein